MVEHVDSHHLTSRSLECVLHPQQKVTGVIAIIATFAWTFYDIAIPDIIIILLVTIFAISYIDVWDAYIVALKVESCDRIDASNISKLQRIQNTIARIVSFHSLMRKLNILFHDTMTTI